MVRQNRAFGDFLTAMNELPQTVVMLVEGEALGGGMGLVCVSDIAIAVCDTQFALTETGFGLPAAQVVAFVVQRIGLAFTPPTPEDSLRCKYDAGNYQMAVEAFVWRTFEQTLPADAVSTSTATARRSTG